jgi:hypothetical protein
MRWTVSRWTPTARPMVCCSVTRRNTDRRHHRPSRRHTAELGGLPSSAERPHALSHRPNSGTCPTLWETASRRHSGAARSPRAWLRCGGSPDTTRRVRRDRPPGRPGSAGQSSFNSPTVCATTIGAPVPAQRVPFPVPPEAVPGLRVCRPVSPKSALRKTTRRRGFVVCGTGVLGPAGYCTRPDEPRRYPIVFSRRSENSANTKIVVQITVI